MKTALIIAFTYWLIFVIDESFSWQALVRPIVTGPIVGLMLGDVKTGAIMGGLIESVYMGVVSIGGGAPADAFGATVITVTFVITGGLSVEEGLALAFPIGTLTRNLTQFALPMHAFLIRYFEKFVEEGNVKAYVTLQQAYRFLFARLLHTITIFFAIWLGSDVVAGIFNILPPYVLDGLKVAGGILPALGLGILVSMIFNKEQGAYLIIGFALTTYLGLNTMAIAILAGAVAVLYFFTDVKRNEAVLAANNKPAKDNEEDFFG